jgi:hypothetical protein
MCEPSSRWRVVQAYSGSAVPLLLLVCCSSISSFGCWCSEYLASYTGFRWMLISQLAKPQCC